MTREQERKPIRVIGAGFSGLAAAHYLNKKGYQVEVFEAQGRAGGLIQTHVTPYGLVETAANALLASHRLEDLCEEVGVELLPSLNQARARYIVRDQKARRLPLRFFELLRLLWGVFLLVVRWPSVQPRAGESIQAWGTRVLGRNASRYTLETGLQGIYAGDATRMSASLILGPLLSQTKSNVPSKFKGSVSPRGGMGELIEKWHRHLEKHGVVFRLNSPCEEKDLLRADQITVIATSAHQAAALLARVDEERSKALAQIEMLPLVSATVHWPESAPTLEGFGCLFPSGESEALGVLLNRYIFAGRCRSSLSETWIFGGAQDVQAAVPWVNRTDDEILAAIRRERSRVIGPTPDPLRIQITRWPRALPHITTEMESLRARYLGSSKNIFLIGNYTGGIGLSKILDQAIQLADEIEAEGLKTC